MAKRKMCSGCSRPVSVCLCEHFVSLQAPCNVLILQHPSEQKQALATVPILQHCIRNLQVRVGEVFAEEDVLSLINRPEQCRVLFPANGAQAWSFSTDTVAVTGERDEPIEWLIILDGTWRKAKRIWHLNPWLEALPCVCLEDVPKSEYQIRSSTIEGGVSTLETLVYACNYLSKSADYDLLLQPFRAMIDLQIKKMGLEVYQAHYAQAAD